MSTDVATLKIVHASLEVFDSNAQAIADMEKLVELEADMLGGTESGDVPRQNRYKAILDQAGYRVLMPPQTDGWLAVKRDLIHTGWNPSYDEVFPSGRELGHPHPHSGRGVVKASFKNRDLGKITFIGGVHYMTLGKFPGQARQDNPRCDVDHVMWNKRYGLEVSSQALRGAMGKGLSFVTGDMNMIDRTDDVFFRKPLTTCWDELGKWPNTGHGNIDIVASADQDGRVSCKSAKVLDDQDLRLFTDHFVVVTKYDVKTLTDRK